MAGSNPQLGAQAAVQVAVDPYLSALAEEVLKDPENVTLRQQFAVAAAASGLNIVNPSPGVLTQIAMNGTYTPLVAGAPEQVSEPVLSVTKSPNLWGGDDSTALGSNPSLSADANPYVAPASEGTKDAYVATSTELLATKEVSITSHTGNLSPEDVELARGNIENQVATIMALNPGISLEELRAKIEIPNLNMDASLMANLVDQAYTKNTDLSHMMAQAPDGASTAQQPEEESKGMFTGALAFLTASTMRLFTDASRTLQAALSGTNYEQGTPVELAALGSLVSNAPNYAQRGIGQGLNA